MNTYYGTFAALNVKGDFFVRIMAPTMEIARAAMADQFKDWCTVYDEERWAELGVMEYFPRGCLLAFEVKDEHLNMRVLR